MKTALCPGSFDPLTCGHVHIVERVAQDFERVVVCVADNDQKTYVFTAEERVALCRKALAHLANVEVVRCEGMLVEAFREHGADVIVKGIRSEADLAYEQEMAAYNRKLEPRAETEFLWADEPYRGVSSSELKRRIAAREDVTGWVPEAIREEVVKKIADI